MKMFPVKLSLLERAIRLKIILIGVLSLFVLSSCMPNYYYLMQAESTYSPRLRAEYLRRAYGQDFFGEELNECHYRPENYEECSEQSSADKSETTYTYYPKSYGSFTTSYR